MTFLMIQKASTLSGPLLIVFGIRAGLSLVLVLCIESFEAKKNNSCAEVSLSGFRSLLWIRIRGTFWSGRIQIWNNRSRLVFYINCSILYLKMSKVVVYYLRTFASGKLFFRNVIVAWTFFMENKGQIIFVIFV
jgi:hypothetical protein